MINWETDFTAVRIPPGPCPEEHPCNKDEFQTKKTICMSGAELCSSSAIPCRGMWFKERIGNNTLSLRELTKSIQNHERESKFLLIL